MRLAILPDPLAIFRGYTNFSYALDMDNTSGNVSLLYADPTNILLSGYLEIFRYQSGNMRQICFSKYSGSSGSANCTVTNLSGQEYLVKACFEKNVSDSKGEATEFHTYSFVMGSRQNAGMQGPFWAVLLGIVAFIMGIMFGGTAVAFLCLALWFVGAGFMGLWPGSYPLSAIAFLIFGIMVYTTRS